MADVELLPAHLLIKTNPLDQGDWSTSGVLGWIERQRFRMAARLLGTRRHDHLLEVGYGSGIFLPELARHAERLAGADVHEKPAEVAEVLAGRGITADLRTASVTDLPWPDDTFDAAVVVSALEFVDDIDGAAAELGRTIRGGGTLVVVTPGDSKVLDAGHFVLTRTRAEDTFQGRRAGVVPALERRFSLEETVGFPPLAPGPVRMFRALRFVNR